MKAAAIIAAVLVVWLLAGLAVALVIGKAASLGNTETDR